MAIRVERKDISQLATGSLICDYCEQQITSDLVHVIHANDENSMRPNYVNGYCYIYNYHPNCWKQDGELEQRKTGGI